LITIKINNKNYINDSMDCMVDLCSFVCGKCFFNQMESLEYTLIIEHKCNKPFHLPSKFIFSKWNIDKKLDICDTIGFIQLQDLAL